jgi:hypothetical protein
MCVNNSFYIKFLFNLILSQNTSNQDIFYLRQNNNNNNKFIYLFILNLIIYEDNHRIHILLEG